jgi:hypothetical protein
MRKVLLAGVASALAVTPASAEKMTMLCGNLEVLVVVKRNPNTSRWTKIDIYPADPNTTMTTEDKQLEVKEDGYLYINDKKCIATLYWICPADGSTC